VATLGIVPELFALPHVRVPLVLSAIAGVLLGWFVAARLTSRALIQKS